jgi:exodeoxyribonuclease VII small subunit
MVQDAGEGHRRTWPTSLTGVAEEELGYERARDELTEVVRKLEAGGLTLEDSLALWERGEYLAKVCQQWLDGARARLAAAITADEPDAQE